MCTSTWRSTWVVGNTVSVPVVLRAEGREESGYNYRRLFSLFWKMVLCSGTRGLRLVSMLGVTLALAGVIMAAVVIVQALTQDNHDPEGWASIIVVMLLCSGAMLFSLGLIAEYLGVALHILVGKPLYLTVRLDTAPGYDACAGREPSSRRRGTGSRDGEGPPRERPHHLQQAVPRCR